MKQIKICIIVCLVFFSAHSCSNSDENPFPLIDSISPNSRAVSLPGFTLTVNGSGFTEDSVVIINGSSQKTDFISETQITCEVVQPRVTPLQGQVQSQEDLDIKVSNPEPGGGVSKSFTLTFMPNFTFENQVQIPLILDIDHTLSYAPFHQYFDQQKIFIVWPVYNAEIRKDELFYITSEDSGKIWSKFKRLLVPADYNDIRASYSKTWGHIAFVYLRSKSVFIVESDDFGNNWSTPFLIWNSDSKYEPLFVSLLSHQNGVLDLILSSDLDLFLFHRPSDSKSWEKIELFREERSYLTEFTTGPEGQLYCYWNYLGFEGAYFPSYFFFKYSDSYNSSWSPKLEVEPVKGHLADFFVNKNSGLNIFYGYTTIKMINSDDGGFSWSEPKTIAENKIDYYSIDKWVTKDSLDNFNIVYREDKKFMFKRSVNSGNDFSEAIPFFNKIYVHFRNMNAFNDKTGELHFIWEETEKHFIYATTIN